jgi:hypothetical protein
MDETEDLTMANTDRKSGLVEQLWGGKVTPAVKPKVSLAPPRAASATPPEAMPATEPPAPAAADDSGEENCTAYGFYRGRHERATDIEFEKRDGSSLGLGYAWLPSKEFLPEAEGGQGQAIRLESSTGVKVTIRGRNLRLLFTRILRQQVFRVTEMGEASDRFLPDEDTVTYAIDIEKPEPLEAAGGGKSGG